MEELLSGRLKWKLDFKEEHRKWILERAMELSCWQWNCLAGNGIDRNCSWKGSSSMGRPPEVALTDKVASWAQQPVKVYEA